MVRLSVIVPMYNVASFVGKCIQSLENQDIPKEEYEIICVNDGSTDNSKEVITRYQERFTNIVLVNQDNAGVSRARNTGIDRACGDYLLFVDADDFVDRNRFKMILRNADDKGALIYFLGYTILNEDGTIQKHELYEEGFSGEYHGIEAYYLTHSSGKSNPDSSCAILMKREFLNMHDLRYLPDVPYLEDGEFMSRLLCLADMVIFDALPFYNRTTRAGSATNSFLFHSERATKGFLLAAGNLKDFQKQRDLNEKQDAFLNQPLCKYVILAINSAQKPFNIKRIKSVKEKLNDQGLSKLDLTSVNIEYRKLGEKYNRSTFSLIVYLFKIKVFNSLKYRVELMKGSYL